MRFLIIIPAHNEESHILSCLESLKNQSFRDFCCVVVNDHSTDRTEEMVNLQIRKGGNFHLVNREETFYGQQTVNNNSDKNVSSSPIGQGVHSPGAKVVKTFNFGLNTQDMNDFDIICKFDADIVFPSDYLQRVNAVYEENSKVGMVSGLVYVEKNGVWQFENLSSKSHIRGPIKSYRKECFQAMAGLREVLGWDNIDVMLCKMHGFEVFSIKDIWVKHLRPTAYKYKYQKAEKLGEYFYNIGLNLPLAVISSVKSSFKNRSLSEFFITIKSFIRQKHPRPLTKKEQDFVRNLRWEEMKRKLF